MHLSAVLTVVAGLAHLGASAPVNDAHLTKRSFSVPQVSTGRQKVKPVLAIEMANTFAKYGKTDSMPAVVRAAALAAVNSGTVTATPQSFDSEYLCPVSVGTPAQTLMLNFDTGSSDLWTFSSEMPSSQSAGHKIYTPAQSSSSSLMSGQTWKIQYGDGSSASGNVFQDTVSVGASTFATQAVEAAQNVSAQFLRDTASSGLLGLAFSSINTVRPTQQLTFFDNIKNSLPAPVFTANLRKGQAGNYNFGYIDSAEYTGSITYVNVITSRGFWEFTGNGYAVGSGAFTSASIDAIADTGTTLLYLPAAIVQAYWAQNSGTNSATYGGYVFPCSTTLKSITLGIGSYQAVVPGSFINYAPVSSGSNTCFGGIQPDTGLGISIYGDIFLKSQFVVFSGANPPQLGFAAKDLGNYTPPSSAPGASTTSSTTTTRTTTTTTTTRPTTTTTTTTRPPTTTTITTTTTRPTTTTTITTTTTRPTTTTTTRPPTTTTASTTRPAATTTTTRPTTTTTITRQVMTTTTRPTTTTRTTTTQRTSSTTTSAASASNTCFADLINNKRTFADARTSSSSMSNDYCQRFCNNKGYAWSGTEVGRQCFCSDTAPTVASSNCNFHCPGSADFCGGRAALSVRHNPALLTIVIGL